MCQLLVLKGKKFPPKYQKKQTTHYKGKWDQGALVWFEMGLVGNWSWAESVQLSIRLGNIPADPEVLFRPHLHSEC